MAVDRLRGARVVCVKEEKTSASPFVRDQTNEKRLYFLLLLLFSLWVAKVRHAEKYFTWGY